MIIPAIDLIGGEVVRLAKGDYGAQTTYAADPTETARSFVVDGADIVHIVDLEAAKTGAATQRELIARIAAEMPIQTGGGIRRRADLDAVLATGVKRAVIGSTAVNDIVEVAGWLRDIGGDAIVLAFDCRMSDGVPRPAVKGWLEDSDRTLWDVLDAYAATPLARILVTDIGRDGMLGGANVELYREIMDRYPQLALITSGGVGTLDDVRALKALNPDGIIVGKALYETRFTLAEAMAC